MLTKATASGFAAFAQLDYLYIWCSVSRAAMPSILAVPQLAELTVWSLEGPGRLRGFATAAKLTSFQAIYQLKQKDFIEIARAPALRQLSAHNSHPTLKAVDALIALDSLREIDFEATRFDDAMAARIATSTRIERLELGHTRLTGTGLRHIAGMPHLRGLDLWANDIELDELDCLADLPQLEFLSLGSTQSPSRFAGEALMQKLRPLTSLKKIWLDGVELSEAEQAELNERIPDARIDPPG